MNRSRQIYAARALSLCLCFMLTGLSTSVLAKTGTMEKRVKKPYMETLLRYKAMQKAKAGTRSSNSAIKPFIVGGVDANPNAYPWMTALLISEIPDAQFAQFCGGSLVAPDVVVTAAHCVDGIPSELVEVAVGNNDLRTVTSAERINIKGYVVHPDWDYYNIVNDIAIIKLAKAVDNPTLSLINPVQMDGLVAGDSLTAIGFGVLNDFTFDTPDVLQEVQLAYWDHATCNDAFAFLGGINETQICAGSPTNGIEDSCFGDSGGPLMANIAGEWKLTGIVSWGIGCGLPDYPGVYTKAANYVDWVATAANSLYIDTMSYFDFVGVGEERVISRTVENWGSQARTIESITFNDPGLGFTISESNCLNRILAPSEACNLVIKFKPVNEGIRDGYLQVTASDGNTAITHMFGIGLAESKVGTALDNQELNWYSGISAYWSEVSMADAVGGTALQAGAITDAQYTAIHTHVEGPGTISFNWKVSAEDYYDYLFLVVDGNIVNAITGDTPWISDQYEITGSGNHAVTWVFYKDIIISQYQDTAWLDVVTWTPNTAQQFKLNAQSDGGGGSLSWLLLIATLFPLIRNRA